MTGTTAHGPRIWVDADATPAAVKDILYRTATRRAVDVVFVANYHLGVPRGPHLKSIQVSGGFDVADDYIAKHALPGDLVITQDIPLAAQVIDKGAAVINNRGEEYTADNIRPRLNLRDFMDTMRSSGAHSGGPPPFGQREKQAFANALDRWLARR